MSVYGINELRETDPQVWDYIIDEEVRQEYTLELIASENICSKAIRAAVGSVLTNKYAEGYPNKRYYGGCDNIDAIEEVAIARAKQLFGAEHANVQPHCGTTANLAAYAAVCNVGDTILAMSLDAGGHLSHGYPITMSGKLYNFVHYGVTPEGYIDYNQVRELAHKHHPKLIVAGASAYPRIIDFKLFREIADEVGALLLVDMAHIAGLVAAGVHPSPVPYADIVTSTTHKTMRGPRGGFILCRADLAKAIDKSVFPANQGGPLEHIIAGKAVMFLEALQPSFREYQQHVVDNAAVLADELLGYGHKLVSGGTDNHLLLLDLTNTGMTGKELEVQLDKIGITVNKNAIPFDPLPPAKTSGIRIGTPTITTRGMGAQEMKQIARIIHDVIAEPSGAKKHIEEVHDLCCRFPLGIKY